jgi:enoyl-CoA hydratase/carnithine racemase
MTETGALSHDEIAVDGDDLVECRPVPIPGAAGVAAMITLNRPDQLNAITWDMVEALDRAVTAAIGYAEVRAILVTGRGRAFSAGGDLKVYQTLQRDPTRFPAFVTALHKTFGRLRTLAVPVVALVNGVTAAGGLELLLNCDLAIAAESATIGDAHLNYGQMGGGGVLTLLPRIVGLPKATELILTGRFLTAAEAVDWGLVSRTVPDADLIDEGLAFAASIARKSPLAVANAKYVLTSIWSDMLSVTSGLRLERERNALYCLTSEDAPEGLAAFADKREPNFKGR